MWVLQLNPMMDNYENLRACARAETREALERFVAIETVERYTDDAGTNMMGGKLWKSFRKGGPLEFLNPPDRPECYVEVSLDVMLERVRRDYDQHVNSLLLIS